MDAHSHKEPLLISRARWGQGEAGALGERLSLAGVEVLCGATKAQTWSHLLCPLEVFLASSALKSTDSEWKDLSAQAFRESRKNGKPLSILLDQLREELPRGGWTRFLEASKFAMSRSEGFKFAGIGKWLRKLNVRVFGRLPGMPTALDHLRRLSPEVTEACVEDERIHPQMGGPEAAQLVASIVGLPPEKESSPRQKRILSQLHRLGRLFENCSDAERNLFRDDPKQTLTHIACFFDACGTPLNKLQNSFTTLPASRFSIRFPFPEELQTS